MTRIINNIEAVQINLSNQVDRFYLPDNVIFHGKKISSISILNNKGGNYYSISPFGNGVPIDDTILKDFYIEVVKDNKEILHQNLAALSTSVCLSYRIAIDTSIDITLTNLTYRGSANLTGKCIILYITWDDEQVDLSVEPSKHGVSISPIIPSGESVRLSDYIDDYIQKQGFTIKGIEASISDVNKGYFLDLRSTDGRTLRYIPHTVLINSLATGVDYLHIDSFNIDFKNSYIVSGKSSNVQINLTFYY